MIDIAAWIKISYFKGYQTVGGQLKLTFHISTIDILNLFFIFVKTWNVLSLNAEHRMVIKEVQSSKGNVSLFVVAA